MTIDMSKYLGIFISESTEHLEALSHELVLLEKDAGGGTIDSVFRHAHSVKGMAASMGFEPIAKLAHRVEDLVDAVREDRGLLNNELVDLLLSAADILTTQVKSAGEGRPIEDASLIQGQLSEKLVALGRAPVATRVAKTVVAVQALLAETPAEGRSGAGDSGAGASGAGGSGAGASGAGGSGAGASGAGASSEGAAGSRDSGGGVPVLSLAHAEPPPLPTLPELGISTRIAVRVRISPTCQVPGVRAFLVHKKLSSLGSLLDLRPSLDDLRGGRIPDGLISVDLETVKGESAILASLKNVSEVEVVSLKVVTQAPEPPIVPSSPSVPQLPVAASGGAAAAAQAAPIPSAEAAPRPVGAESARTVRVRTELLDYFLDTVGELLLATARIKEVGKALPKANQEPLEEAVYRLHGLVKDLHDKVMTVRMTPLSFITDRLPRAARDIARRRGRDMDLIIGGAEIELDRSIIDDLADPLLHILRNCIDHGVEPPEERVLAGKASKGRVSLQVRRVRDRVVIEIEDDGRGMDPNKLRTAAVARGLLTPEVAQRLTDKEAFLLACLPGVSTAKDVSEISGRGVGMDAVKRTVESVGGTLEIESERGRGSKFILRLPLTVAVVQLLLVQVGEEVFGLPIGKVLGALEADSDVISRSQSQAVLPYGTALLPVYELGVLLSVPAPARIGQRPYVVMEGDTGKVALAVDRLLGQEEVVLKALSRPLDLVPGLSGVTILGSGRPVFILDVPRLLAA
jgi:two-component system, chemotaxis family, sensor kinase CheA